MFRLLRSAWLNLFYHYATSGVPVRYSDLGCHQEGTVDLRQLTLSSTGECLFATGVTTNFMVMLTWNMYLYYYSALLNNENSCLTGEIGACDGTSANDAKSDCAHACYAVSVARLAVMMGFVLTAHSQVIDYFRSFAFTIVLPSVGLGSCSPSHLPCCSMGRNRSHHPLALCDALTKSFQ